MAVPFRTLGRFSLLLFLAVLGASCADTPRESVGAGPPAGGQSAAGVEGGEGERPFATLALEASFPAPFNYLTGVRELPGGELLAADPLGVALLRMRLETGEADTLGGVGEGPQEYRQPDQVFPLPGDSTLLVDLGKGRLITVDPGGRFVAETPMVRPSGTGFPALLLPRFVDGAGRIYYQGDRSRQGGAPDSVPVARFHPRTGVTDTVAMLWAPETQVRGRGGRGFLPLMLEARDDWAAGTDGRVAVIRALGFSVEWRYPDGRVVIGPPTPWDPTPVGAAEKQAALEEAVAGGMSIVTMASPAGVSSMQIRRGGPPGGAEGPRAEDFEWAETLPPFRAEGSFVSPEGEAWVERMLPASEPARMDVFDGSGLRVGYVELPPRSRLIGFGTTAAGERAAYLVRTDEVGLKWLGRFRVARE